LTQTHNRTAFNDSIKREMSLATRNSKSLSLIFFDTGGNGQNTFAITH